MLNGLCPVRRMLNEIEPRECGIQVNVVFGGFVKPFALPVYEDTDGARRSAPADGTIFPTIIPAGKSASSAVIPGVVDYPDAQSVDGLQVLLFLCSLVEIE